MDELKKEMEVIYRRYYSSTFHFCQKMCENNDDLAEEITQETFYKAIQSAQSFMGNCKVKTWLCQIAKNTYISYLRKEKRLYKGETAEQIMENVPDGRPAFQEQMEDMEIAEELWNLLDDMEEPYREVFRLKVQDELEYAQIAELYSKSESWARVTFYRAKQKIIERMR